MDQAKRKEVIKSALENALSNTIAQMAITQVDEQALQRMNVLEPNGELLREIGMTQRNIKVLVQRIGVIEERLKEMETVA